MQKKPIREDAPTVSVAAGGAAGLDNNPPVGNSAPMFRRSKFAGADVFEVNDDVFHNARNGKRKHAHYKTYVGKDEVGTAIRDYGLKNPTKPIVLKNFKTGAMVYLRYGGYKNV